MKQRIAITLIIGLLVSCETKTNNIESSMPHIEGTWELISGTTIVKDDTTFTDYTKGQKMIKVINSSHFAFLRHDLNKGKDSTAIFDSGGGRYTLTGDQYTEHLDYCNHREWEGHSFNFKVAVKNDTLIQSGTEKVEEAGIDRIIIEKYFRVK
ncbi:MAG: hypothetical protein ACXWV6_12145 [Chitinophagaceae bacterium]